MASDSPGDTSVSVNLPESLSTWLDDKASEEGRSREDVLLQLLSAYRKVDGLEDGAVDLPEGMDPGEGRPVGTAADLDERVAELVAEQVDEHVETHLETRVEDLLDAALEDRLAEASIPEDAVDADELDERIGSVESRFVNLIEDVRDRVIQVKREADAKAPADHDHEDLAAADALAELANDLEMARAALDTLESRLEAGFENYEEVLNYLANSIDRVSGRQTTLARALLETREELRKLAARDTARSAAESLKRDANQQGVRAADCGECGGPVDVGLLTRPECPHCSAPFVGVEPAQGFFGSDTLATGERPALEAAAGAEDGFEHDVDDIIDGDESARAGVADELGDADESAAADGDDAESTGAE